MNFRNYGDNPNGDDLRGKPPANVPLTRQSSIYSLTFDELQNTMSGMGKDFGSMNMDELLKNIWTAEETQAFASSVTGGGGGEGHNLNGNLQRQPSITLPRTFSQKTVDEVWRDLIKDGSGNGGSSMPQRQPTLGEMTLEEFLMRAGVGKEDMTQQIGRPNNNGWFGDFSRSYNDNTDLLLRFQQPSTSNGNLGKNRIVEGNNLVPKHPPPPPLSLNSNHSQQQAPQQQQQQPPPLFPKPANVTFAAPSMHMLNNAQLASPGTRGGMIGVPEHSMNGTLVQTSAMQGVGMVGLSTANVTAPGASPASKISPDGIAKSSVDTSSLSPVPYVINRGRKCSALEKVVERRQRRMIKNRESAARSRARKQVSLSITHHAFLSIGNKIDSSVLFLLSELSSLIKFIYYHSSIQIVHNKIIILRKEST